MTTKSKRILRWFTVALGIWTMSGALIGSVTMPPGPRFVTKSPDGQKEFYLYRPFYRRVIYGMMYPIKWPVNLVTVVFAGSPFGSLYLPNYSLYVRETTNGRSSRYSPGWTGTWSPDSRWIAAGGPKIDERVSLMLIDTEARREHIIPSPDASPNFVIQDVTWSRDSMAVHFRQEYKVCSVDIENKSLVVVADDQKDDPIDILKIVADWKANSEHGDTPGPR